MQRKKEARYSRLRHSKIYLCVLAVASLSLSSISTLAANERRSAVLHKERSINTEKRKTILTC